MIDRTKTKIVPIREYYYCNRTRQTEWLRDHGFIEECMFQGEDGYWVWKFKKTPELIACLNEYTKSRGHKVVYI